MFGDLWLTRILRATGGLGLLALAAMAVPSPASAQFSFFGLGDASTQDIYDTIASNGFRMVGPLVRNGDVFVADVVDRRQRRQRLIIARSSGQIVQRFFVDLNGRGAPRDKPLPRPPVVRSEEPDFFSRLVRGFSDDAPQRPPGTIDGPAGEAVSPPAPRPARPLRPRDPDTIATRRDDAPITARPLPGPTPLPVPTPSAPASSPVTATVPSDRPIVPATPPSTAASPPPARATVVTTDPLRIPGSRDKEPARPPAGSPAKATPAADVPVAPLD